MVISLTPEQWKLVPRYQERWTKRFFSFDFDEMKVYRLIDFLYGLIDKKPPIKIILDSPLSCQIAINLLKGIKICERETLFDPGIDSQLNSKLHSQLSSKLSSELNSKLFSKLSSKLNSKLSSELSSKLSSKLSSELYSELNSQLNPELISQLYSQLSSQLYSELSSELYSKLYSELYSKLDSKLDSELRSELYSKLASQLNLHLFSKLSSELSPELRSKLDSCVPSLKMGYYPIDIWGDVSWYGYLAFYDFLYHEVFKDVKMPLFEEYVKLADANITSLVTFEGIAFISRPPTFIKFNDNNRLHCRTDYALTFADGWRLAYLNGYHIPSDLFERFRKDKLSFNDLMRIENIETRYALLAEYDKTKLFKEGRCKLVHSSARGNELYSSDLFIKGKTVKFLRYICPSTGREYLKFVNARFDDADKAMAYHQSRNMVGYARLIDES